MLQKQQSFTKPGPMLQKVTSVSYARNITRCIGHCCTMGFLTYDCILQRQKFLLYMPAATFAQRQQFYLELKYFPRSVSLLETQNSTPKTHNTLTKKCGNSNTCVTQGGWLRTKMRRGIVSLMKKNL